MILTFNKDINGTTYTHHVMKTPDVDMQAQSITTIIKSWTNEGDALANNDNAVISKATKTYTTYDFTLATEMHTRIPSLAWVEPDIAPQETLSQAKARKKKEINATKDMKEVSGFTYAGHDFQSDMKSAMRIAFSAATAKTALANNQTFNLEWTSKNNVDVPMTAAQLVELELALTQHSRTLHNISRAKKQQVDNATTLAEVDAITWS